MNFNDTKTYKVVIDGVEASGTLAKLAKLFGVDEVQKYLSTNLRLHYSESKGQFVEISTMDDRYLRNVIAKLVAQFQDQFIKELHIKKNASNTDFYKFLAGGVKFSGHTELDNLLAELNKRIAESNANNRNAYKSLL